MDRLMTVVAGASVALIVLVLASVRREHIRVEYSVSWLTAGIVLLGLSLSRGSTEWLASVLGVADPPLAILMVVFSVFLVVIYRLSIRVSALKDDNIRLAQRVAILEFYLKSNGRQEKTSGG